MKLGQFLYNGDKWIGIVEEDTVQLVGGYGKCGLVAAIRGGQAALEKLRTGMTAANTPGRVDLSAVEVLPPISCFYRDILCTGWNFYDHFTEGIGRRDGQEVERPVAPTFFTKSPDVVVPPFGNIAYDPRISAKWDYEGEVAVIIGRDGRSIPESAAMDYVFGFCLANDVSQRDLQRRHGGQWLKGKSIDNTMPLGPWIVTKDDVDLRTVRLQTFVNGSVMQDAVLSQMAFPLPQLLAELSFGMTVHAGDVLLTGTPSGVGNARTPQVFLKENDEVLVRATGLGELRNRLRASDLHQQSNVTVGVGG